MDDLPEQPLGLDAVREPAVPPPSEPDPRTSEERADLDRMAKKPAFRAIWVSEREVRRLAGELSAANKDAPEPGPRGSHSRSGKCPSPPDASRSPRQFLSCHNSHGSRRGSRQCGRGNNRQDLEAGLPIWRLGCFSNRPSTGSLHLLLGQTSVRSVPSQTNRGKLYQPAR